MNNEVMMTLTDLINKVRVCTPDRFLGDQYAEQIKDWYDGAGEQIGDKNLIIGFTRQDSKVLCRLFNAQQGRVPGEMSFEVETDGNHFVRTTIKPKTILFTISSFAEEEAQARKEERGELSVADLVANAKKNSPAQHVSTTNFHNAEREVKKRMAEGKMLNPLNRPATPRAFLIVNLMAFLASQYDSSFMTGTQAAEVRITYDKAKDGVLAKVWKLEFMKAGEVELAIDLHFD